MTDHAGRSCEVAVTPARSLSRRGQLAGLASPVPPILNNRKDRMMTPEWTARVLLRWALDETIIRIPRKLQRPAAWRWSEDDQQLVALTDDGEYRYHTALTHGRAKVRHAVLTVADDNGKVKWEADIPADIYEQAKGGAV